MSVIQEPANAYAAITQVDGAVSETEQRRRREQRSRQDELVHWKERRKGCSIIEAPAAERT